jgi:aspartyl-tRNA(Asn)/glutamyl-tRNA(Gln) amidotransferase subunit A
VTEHVQRQVLQALNNIRQWNPVTNAMLVVAERGALARAAQIDQRSSAGDWCGLLAGVTVSLKDCIDWLGTPTTAASIILKDNYPGQNAFVVQRLLDQGAVITGKANLHEWVFGPTSQSRHFGPVKNPWNPDCFAGGSSGGSGVAVATGMCQISIGSDTAGSIRIPAAFNGVSGLRPTIGRISRQGSITVSRRFDSLGPLARRVSDVARAFTVIAGYDPKDVFADPRPVPNIMASLNSPVQGMRIGVMRRWFFDDIHPQLKVALDRAISIYKQLGVDVVEVDLGDVNLAQEMLGFRIILADAYAVHQQQLQCRRADYGDDVLIRFDLGKAVTGSQYSEALNWIERFKMRLNALWPSFDALLHPTTPGPAPGIAGMNYAKAIQSIPRFTCVHAAAGSPALALPCGFTDQGLPLSMELAGAAFQEEKILKLGHAYQCVTDHHLQEPVFARLGGMSKAVGDSV